MQKEVIIAAFGIVIAAIGAALYYGTDNGAQNSAVPIESEFETKVVYTTNMETDMAPLRADCKTRGGTFNSCGTSCAPDAAICTEVCAYTCENIGMSTSTEEDTGARAIPDDWERYENSAMGFEMSYPPSVTIQPSEIPGQGASVRFYAWGPTQERDTELYDGLSITITRTTYNTDTLRETAEQTLEAARPAAQEVIDPVHEITLGGETGYAYRIRSQGEHTVTFLPLDEKELLRIAHRAHDPTLQGFEDTLQTMLESLEVTK